MNPTFSISEVINSSWEIVKKNIWFFAGSLFASMALFYTIYFAAYFLAFGAILMGEVQEFDPALVGIFMIIYFLVLLPLAIYFSTVFITMSLRAADGEKVDFSVFSVPFRTLAHVLLGVFLFTTIVYIGILFCIIPGIYLAIRLQFFMFYIIDKKCNALDALYNSWARTKGVEMDLFVFNLVQGLIGFLGALCCGIGVLVAYPIVYVAMALVYRRGDITNPTVTDTTPMQQPEER